MSDASEFVWLNQAVPFRDGETIAAALSRAGIHDLGQACGSQKARYFCGIGTCQACLVSVNGMAPVEACLTLATTGMRLSASAHGTSEADDV